MQRDCHPCRDGVYHYCVLQGGNFVRILCMDNCMDLYGQSPKIWTFLVDKRRKWNRMEGTFLSGKCLYL